MEINLILLLGFAWLWDFAILLINLAALDEIGKERLQAKTYSLKRAKYFFACHKRYTGKIAKAVFWIQLAANIFALIFVPAWITLVVTQINILAILCAGLFFGQLFLTLVMIGLNIAYAAKADKTEEETVPLEVDNKVTRITKTNSIMWAFFGGFCSIVYVIAYGGFIYYFGFVDDETPFIAFLIFVAVFPFILFFVFWLFAYGMKRIKITPCGVKVGLFGAFFVKRLHIDQIVDILAVRLEDTADYLVADKNQPTYYNVIFSEISVFNECGTIKPHFEGGVFNEATGFFWKPVLFGKWGLTKTGIKKLGLTEAQIRELRIFKIDFMFSQSELDIIGNILKKPIRYNPPKSNEPRLLGSMFSDALEKSHTEIKERENKKENPWDKYK